MNLLYAWFGVAMHYEINMNTIYISFSIFLYVLFLLLFFFALPNIFLPCKDSLSVLIRLKRSVLMYLFRCSCCAWFFFEWQYENVNQRIIDRWITIVEEQMFLCCFYPHSELELRMHIIITIFFSVHSFIQYD